MLEHFAQQRKVEFELSTVGKVIYFPNFQVKQMNDCTLNSQSIYAGSSFTQLLWSNQILKYGNEDVNQDVPNNMYDMLVTEFIAQRKDE